MHTDQPEVNLPKKVFVKVEGASDLAEIAKQLAEARWRYGSGAPVQVLPS